MRVPMIVLAAMCLVGCADSTTGPVLPIDQPKAAAPEPEPEVVPILATTVPPLEPQPEPEAVAEATATMDENAARLGDVVHRVDELVASALEIQKSLLLIYAAEEEQEEQAEAETETEAEETTKDEPA